MEPQELVNQPKSLKYYFTPSLRVGSLQSLVCTQGIKSNIFQMLPSFKNHSNEEPYRHLKEFLRVCSIIKDNDDAL